MTVAVAGTSGSRRRLPPRRIAARRAAATRLLAIAAIVIAALLAPLFVRGFVTFQLTLVMVYGLAILGLNLLTGFNGQFSLGHSAFYGIGAYTAAILMDRWDLPYYATLPAAGAVCFVVGFLFGFPALRLQGHLSRAGDLRARDRDAADPEIRPALAVDRRRAGDRDPEARPAVRPAARRRPVALLFHAGGAAGHVRGGRQSGQEPHRPRDHGDPRQPDRRGGDGHRHGALQDR